MTAARRDRPPRTPLEQLTAKAKRTAAQQELQFQLVVKCLNFRTEWEWHPRRKYRCDFFLPRLDRSLIVEVDGGLFVNGGHTRGAARERDYERDAEAMLLGFRVLRCSPRQVKQGKAIRWIAELLK